MIAIVVAAILWGFGFVFGKYALQGMPVDAMVTYRFATASIALLPVIFWRRIRVQRGDLALFAIAGVFYVPVQFLLQFEGLSLTSLTHASLVVALLPVLIAIASSIFTANRAPKWIPIAASAVGGALVVLRPGGNASFLGDVLVLLSLLGAVAYVMLSEGFVKRYDPIVSSTYTLWMGSAVLIAFEAAVHPHDLAQHYNTGAWIATIASGVLCTAVTTVLWNVGLRAISSADAGIFLNIETIIGAVAGIFFFGDSFGWPVAIGGAFIIAGAIAVCVQREPSSAEFAEAVSSASVS